MPVSRHQHYLKVKQRLSAADKLTSGVEAKVRHCRETYLSWASNDLIHLAQIQRLVHLAECQRLAGLTEVQRLIDRTQIDGLTKLQLRADLTQIYRLVDLTQADSSRLLLRLLGQDHLRRYARVLYHSS